MTRHHVHFVLLALLLPIGGGCSHGQSGEADARLAWDVGIVPALSIPAENGTWKPFYHLYDFSLAAETYGQDPAFAYLIFHKYQTTSSIEWKEAKEGDNKQKHELMPDEKQWLGDAAAKLRPAALAYCRWLDAKAVRDKDARTAMAATLLWLKLEFLDKGEPRDDTEKLARILGFITGEQQAKAIDLVRGEMRGQIATTPQWQISNLTTSWSSEYSKSFGLSTLTISPPTGKALLHVRAQVRNVGTPVTDSSSLPMYQSTPRDFRGDTAVDWWKEGTESMLGVPPKPPPPRRLLTVDMVNLVEPDLSESPEQWPLKQLIPCHVVGDDCNVLRGPMCDVMMMLLTLTKTAGNPTLISTGSWVGQGTEFTVEAYFAVPKTATINYSLYVMGTKPVKLPQPKET